MLEMAFGYWRTLPPGHEKTKNRLSGILSNVRLIFLQTRQRSAQRKNRSRDQYLPDQVDRGIKNARPKMPGRKI